MLKLHAYTIWSFVQYSQQFGLVVD